MTSEEDNGDYRIDFLTRQEWNSQFIIYPSFS